MLRVRPRRCCKSRLAACCLFLSFLAILPRPGRAQEGAPREYSEAVQQALQELDANNLAEALAEFRRAHQIFPNARSLRGLGMVEFDLRDYESAARHLREALASAVKPLAGAMRSAAETLLARAQRYLSEVRVATEPRAAQIFVDGSPAQPRPDGMLLLNPGDHVIEVKATGYATETRSLQLSGGDQRELMISLRALAGRSAPEGAAEPLNPAPLAQQTPSRSEALPVYRKWWVWTLVAVALVGGGTTAAILLTQRKGSGSRPVQGTNTVDGVHLHALSSF